MYVYTTNKKIFFLFGSIQGWNTLTSLFGIYFSVRTAFVVIRFIYTRKGLDKPKTSSIATRTTGIESNSPTTITSNSTIHQKDENPSFSSRTIASIPIFVCIRLVSFGVLYCAVTILVYGRNLILSIQRVPYDPKNLSWSI